MEWAKHARDWPMADHSRFVRHLPHHWHVQELGEGPQILLIHGAGGATQSWRHLAPLLAQTHRVIMVDLPGQGFTKIGSKRRCGLDQMSEDLLSLVAHEGWEPSAIIGHSAGGAIALRMTELMTPAPPVVGINAALGNFTGLAGVMFPIMAKALAAMPLVADLFTVSASRPASVKRLIDGTGSMLPEPEIEFYRRLVSDRTHVDSTLAMMAQWQLDPLLKRLPNHPSRTLLITGDKDRAVPPATSDQTAARMPNCTTTTLQGLGHLAHKEDAQSVAALILDHLNADN
jgi:magnesium chelatase accessory protein